MVVVPADEFQIPNFRSFLPISSNFIATDQAGRFHTLTKKNQTN